MAFISLGEIWIHVQILSQTGNSNNSLFSQTLMLFKERIKVNTALYQCYCMSSQNEVENNLKFSGFLFWIQSYAAPRLIVHQTYRVYFLPSKE